MEWYILLIYRKYVYHELHETEPEYEPQWYHNKSQWTTCTVYMQSHNAKKSYELYRLDFATI